MDMVIVYFIYIIVMIIKSRFRREGRFRYRYEERKVFGVDLVVFIIWFVVWILFYWILKIIRCCVLYYYWGCDVRFITFIILACVNSGLF